MSDITKAVIHISDVPVTEEDCEKHGIDFNPELKKLSVEVKYTPDHDEEGETLVPADSVPDSHVVAAVASNFIHSVGDMGGIALFRTLFASQCELEGAEKLEVEREESEEVPKNETIH